MERKQQKDQSRPWVGVMYDCCHAYGRVYMEKSGNRYSGGCPKCGRKLIVKVTHSAKPGKFFRVGK